MEKKFVLRDIMTTEIISVKPDTPLLEAGRLIAQHRFNGLPVVDADHRLIGIVTEYSIIRKSLLPGQRSEVRADMPLVRNVMNPEPLVLSPDASLEEVMAAFRDHHSVNPIPVVDKEGFLVGVVSRSDLLKDIEGTS
ncbi:MAG: CBS domain containing membrane protein [Parcubacteria group bacterium Gr01-1014_66]|nr:MAG: CBS domain containing membrane protein [Parcubacteria group bacterium Gr01-1014_66]